MRSSKVLFWSFMFWQLSVGWSGLVEAATGAEPYVEVTRDELLAYLVEPTVFTLLDARSAEEFAAGHVSGALNVPHDGVADVVALLPENHGAPLVVYCRTGRRAGLLADQLRTLGYESVRVLHPEQMFWTQGLVVFNCSS